MPGLDHVNLETTDLSGSVAFYRDVIGLEVRDPPGLDPARVQWMHDERGHAIIHLSTAGSLLGEKGHERGRETGAVHHVALDCTGHDAMVELLKAQGFAFRQNHVTEIDLRQIFVEDPNGVLLELNYRSGNQE
ncbi:MAG TPA: VOC family protein [Sphingomonadaceae bacterium]|jgi:catechol 2,3-dioxygenase-like lactoylglutathione lyase family enzyme|nr:VOC family protein [Sphingomonadaceae bacterium]